MNCLPQYRAKSLDLRASRAEKYEIETDQSSSEFEQPRPHYEPAYELPPANHSCRHISSLSESSISSISSFVYRMR